MRVDLKDGVLTKGISIEQTAAQIRNAVTKVDGGIYSHRIQLLLYVKTTSSEKAIKVAQRIAKTINSTGKAWLVIKAWK